VVKAKPARGAAVWHVPWFAVKAGGLTDPARNSHRALVSETGF